MHLWVLQPSASGSSTCIKVKNFASNSKHQLEGSYSRTGIHAKGKKPLQDQVQLEIGMKVQLLVGTLG